MYSENKIDRLLSNEDDFLNEIEKSHGFLLEKVINLKKSIPDNLLLKIKETKIGSAYFNEQKKSKKINIYELLDSNITHGLKLEDKNVTLTIEEINQYKNKINDLLNDRNSSVWNSLYSILENSISKLSLNELLNINEDILSHNLSLFKKLSKFSDEKEYKELMVRCINQHCKDNDIEPSILNYFNYKFSKEDSPLLHELLTNSLNKASYYSKIRSYNTLSSKVSGFKNLISPKEYILKYDPLDLPSLPNNEFESNKELYIQNIRQYILGSKKKDGTQLSFFEMTLNNEIKLEQFIEIFNDEFVSTYLKETNAKYLFRSINSIHSEDKLEKILHLFQTCLSQPKELLSKIEPYDLIDGYNDITGLFTQYEFKNVKEKEEEKLKSSFNNYFVSFINESTKTNNIESGIDNFKYYLEQDTKERTNLTFEKIEPSINLYYIVSNYYFDKLNENKRHNINLSNSIKSIWDSLDNLLKNDYNSEIKLIKEKIGLTEDKFPDLYKNQYINKFSKIINDKNNLFLWDSISLNEISLDSLRKIADIAGSSVYDKILKNSTKLENSKVIEIMVPTYINEQNKDIKPRTNFLKEYIAKHKIEIEQNPSVLRMITQSPLQTEIYPYLNKKHQDEEYHTLINLYAENKKYDILSKDIKKIEPQIWKDLKDQKLIESPVDLSFDSNNIKSLNSLELLKLFEEVETNKNYFDNEISKKNNNIVTKKYIEEKVNELFNDRNFDELELLKNNSRNFKLEQISNLLNKLTKEDILKYSYNESFCNLVVASISYDGETQIKFPKMDYSEIKTIIKNIDELAKPNTIKYLNIFRSSQTAIKEYIIEDIPEMVLSVYGFLQYTPPEGRFIKSKTPYLITEPYTSDEIIRLLDNLNKKDAFFSNFDINARSGDHIAQLFSTNKNSEGLQEKFNKVLNHCKANNPISYLLMTSDASLLSELHETKENLSRSECSHNLFLKYFDLKVTIDGLNLIMDKIESNPIINIDNYKKKYNSRLLFGAIRNLGYMSYYEDSFKDSTLYSKLDNSESEKVVELLLDRLPLFTISNINTFGTIKDISQSISLGEIGNIDDTMIDKFLVTNDTADFQLDAQYRVERILKVTNKIIEDKFNDKEIEPLEYVDYLMDKFLDSENYDDEFSDKRSKACQILDLEKNDYTALRIILENSNSKEIVSSSIKTLRLEKELAQNSNNKPRKMKI